MQIFFGNGKKAVLNCIRTKDELEYQTLKNQIMEFNDIDHKNNFRTALNDLDCSLNLVLEEVECTELEDSRSVELLMDTINKIQERICDVQQEAKFI